jgi:hypothetical protein
MGLLNAFSWGYSREDELERELRFWRNRVSELHRQFDADIKRAYAEYKAAYDELRAYTVGKERALAISRAELYEERERVAALGEALKRADEQLAERAVAGSFAIGEPAPDELVVAADDVADAVRGVARALKAASETLTGSKKGSSEFWASAIGRDNLREYVSAAPCAGRVLTRAPAGCGCGWRASRRRRRFVIPSAPPATCFRHTAASQTRRTSGACSPSWPKSCGSCPFTRRLAILRCASYASRRLMSLRVSCVAGCVTQKAQATPKA